MAEVSLGVYPRLTTRRLMWLVRLRWVALAGVSLATVLAAMGFNPGVNLKVLVGAITGGLLFNFYFWRRVKVSPLTRRHALAQVLVDIGALTLVLWAGGGHEAPFASFYLFHIIIGGILVGPKASLVTAVSAIAAKVFLEMGRIFPILRISTWDLPSPIWADAVALLSFVLTVAFIAYFITHIMGELQGQTQALFLERERAEAALDTLQSTRSRELALQDRVTQAERLAGFGRLAQGLAHELNTPLGTIHALVSDIKDAILAPLGAELGRQGMGEEVANLSDAIESCEVIQDESRRCRHITTSLLSGRGLFGDETPKLADLRHIVDHACVLVFSPKEHPPTISITLPKGLILEIDVDRLTQVLVNLLQNAGDAAGSDGLIVVDGEKDGIGFCLHIEDNGPGIPEGVESRLFEPFFTTKEPGIGTGLGLYTAYVIIQKWGGQLDIRNRKGGGAAVSLWLPRTPKSSICSKALET